MTTIRYFAAAALGAALSLSACKHDTPASSSCTGVSATVKDLAGLDGCQFVFELADGSNLLPVLPSQDGTTGDPLSGFTFVDGKKVTIAYEEQKDMMSICMAGKMVKITCLEEQP